MINAGLLSHIAPVPVLIIGDLILDTYTVGKVGRISPEAPVGVVHVQSENAKPGGASNVALNLLSLGCDVHLMGRVGFDVPGRVLLETLEKEGVDVTSILSEEGLVTPHKNRVIADSQQIIRIDHEAVTPLNPIIEEQFIEMIPDLIRGKKAVALSDYGKGFFTARLLEAIIAEARANEIPVIVDPKGADFTRYKGATLIKPNQKEAYLAAHKTSSAKLEEVAATLIESCAIGWLMITRSQDGIALFNQQLERKDFAAQVREIQDVTGAGDTVLAMVTTALANGLSPEDACILANAAAGIAIEHIGCARVTLAELAKKMLTTNARNKVFDDAHLIALKQALIESKTALVDFSAQEEMPAKVYRALTDLKAEGFTILLAVAELESDTLNLLTGLHDIDFIIQTKEELHTLCKVIQPNRFFVSTQEALVEAEELALNS